MSCHLKPFSAYVGEPGELTARLRFTTLLPHSDRADWQPSKARHQPQGEQMSAAFIPPHPAELQGHWGTWGHVGYRQPMLLWPSPSCPSGLVLWYGGEVCMTCGSRAFSELTRLLVGFSSVFSYCSTTVKFSPAINSGVCWCRSSYLIFTGLIKSNDLDSLFGSIGICKYRSMGKTNQWETKLQCGFILPGIGGVQMVNSPLPADARACFTLKKG